MISLDGATHALISLVGYAVAFYYLFQVTWMAYIAIMSLRNLAAWICTHKLDPFDPGHCQ